MNKDYFKLQEQCVSWKKGRRVSLKNLFHCYRSVIFVSANSFKHILIFWTIDRGKHAKENSIIIDQKMITIHSHNFTTSVWNMIASPNSVFNLLKLYLPCDKTYNGPWKGPVLTFLDPHYFDEVYLVTAFVPSDTACLANSPGSKSLTAVWISRDVMVDLLL